jgi:hypothetical protein
MDRATPPPPNEGAPTNDATGDTRPDRAGREGQDDETSREEAPNAPRTTKGKITAPKFGSAGSGGAEFEPGPPKD